MSDISKCTGILEDGKNTICPLRKKCYRYTAPTNPFGQSFTYTPGFFKNGEFLCNLLWERK